MQNSTGMDFLEYQKKWIEMMQNVGNTSFQKEKMPTDAWKDMFATMFNGQKNPFNPIPNVFQQWADFQSGAFKNMGMNLNFPLSGMKGLNDFSFLNNMWDVIQNNIKYGISTPDSMNMFFPNQQLDGFMKQILGMTDNSAFSDLTNQYFATVLKGLEGDTMDWASLLNTNSQNAEFVKPFLGNIEAVQKMFPSKERDELIATIKDTQYQYLLYFYKSNLIQNATLEKSKIAFSSTLSHFTESYKATQELPTYDVFVDKLLDFIDEQLLAYFETKEYSILQSEMVSAYSASKKQTEKIKEFFFKDVPLVKYNEFDDVLIEMSVLKKKNRSLENRLLELEEKLEQSIQRSNSQSESAKTTVKKSK